MLGQVRRHASWGGRGFALILAGQLIGAIGQPLILNIPARVTMDWFGDSERDFATITATMANILGQMAGSLLPALFVKDSADFAFMMLIQAIPCSVVLILAYFVAQDRPTVAPSSAAAQQWADRDSSAADKTESPMRRALLSMWHDAAALMTNGNFVWLAAGFSLATGMAWTLLTLQAQIITPCGYSVDVAGISGASLLGVGVASSFGIGFILKLTGFAYVTTQKLLVCGCAAATVAVLLVNSPNHVALVIAMWCFVGAVLQPLMPVTLEHAAEMTFPMVADSSSTILLVAANLIGCVLTFVLTALVALPSFSNCDALLNPASGVMMSAMILAAVVTLPVRVDYRRKKAARVRDGDTNGSGALYGAHVQPSTSELPLCHIDNRDLDHRLVPLLLASTNATTLT